MEVDAIQKKGTQILQTIVFPDDTTRAFGVSSHTRCKELRLAVVEKLGLVSAEGFSLFIVVGDKVFSVLIPTFSLTLCVTTLRGSATLQPKVQ